MHFYTRDRKSPANGKIPFGFVYLLAVLFNFHTLVVAYVSPTYLQAYFDTSQVGLLYSVGSLGSLFLFLVLPSILKRLGNFFVTITLMLISIMSLAIVGSSSNPIWLAMGLVMFQTINPLIYLNIDIFSETLIGKNEGATGHVRGLVLSLMSIAALLAPLTISYVVGDTDNLVPLYFIAIFVGVLFALCVFYIFKGFIDPTYHKTAIIPLIKRCWIDKPIRLVLATHFLLQIFFTWAILYIPLYMATVIGLSWADIGAVIAVGLLAYVLCEYPIGIIADNYLGEKEMMAAGFMIIAISMYSISIITSASVLIWMSLMFLSRVGASLVEVTTESYFFKKVSGQDANLMSVFRLTRPLSVLVGSLLGSICLMFMPFNLAFVVLGSVMVLGMFVTFGIEDTK